MCLLPTQRTESAIRCSHIKRLSLKKPRSPRAFPLFPRPATGGRCQKTLTKTTRAGLFAPRACQHVMVRVASLEIWVWSFFRRKKSLHPKWFIIYKREHTSFSFCPCSCYETSGLKCLSFFNLLKKFIKHVFYSRESGAENRNVNFNVPVLSQSRLAKEDEKTSCIIFPFLFLYFSEWKQGRVILDSNYVLLIYLFKNAHYSRIIRVRELCMLLVAIFVSQWLPIPG